MQKQQHKLSIFSTLDAYDNAIDSLFEAITFAAPSTLNDHQQRLDSAIDNIISKDQALASALDEVHQHRLNAQKIADLKAQSRDLESQLSSILGSLGSIHRALLGSSRSVPEIDTTTTVREEEKVEYKTLIQYAHRIARHSKRLADVDTSKPLSSSLDLPWPTEEMMRRGVLGILAGPSSAQLTNESSETKANGGDQTVGQDPTNAKFLGDVGILESGAVDGGVGDGGGVGGNGATAMALDLDLFDPDEDE